MKGAKTSKRRKCGDNPLDGVKLSAFKPAGLPPGSQAAPAGRGEGSRALNDYDDVLVLDAAGGWLEGVRRVPSPNRDARPDGDTPELIVVHSISLPAGHFGTPHVEALFCNCLDAGAHPTFPEIASLEVSAHALIRRDGELVQFVPFTERAWHAGVSAYRGRDCCNDFSIGIELEGCDWQPFEDIQYRRLAGLVRVLREAWPAIGADGLVGHSDIAPGRKTDPGPHFDWGRLRRLA
jgi:AmpD protein